jgi:sporulation protein YhbH
MAIFKSHSKSGGRESEDVKRHRDLIEKSIKENIGDAIADNSLIGQNGKQKIKIPLKGIKEYRFVHGESEPQVGSGDGTQKRGARTKGETEQKGKGPGKGDKAGNDEGEDYYEAEITIEELINYLYDDLKLPDIDKKKLANIDSVSYRKLGFQQKGIPPRLAKKKSVIEHLKRTNQAKKSLIDEGEEVPEDFHIPFHEDDLKYNCLRKTVKKNFNAVIFCIMDVSGSMDQTKKYLARSFYFLLYQFLRLKYANTQVVFIAHTTVAKEVSEQEFFNKGESGGTYISTGYNKAIEIIEKRFDPSNWNIYSFYCSDGDNWTEDNQKMVEASKKLAELSNLSGYIELKPANDPFFTSTPSSVKASIKRSNPDKIFTATINKKEDVVPALKKILEKESN